MLDRTYEGRDTVNMGMQYTDRTEGGKMQDRRDAGQEGCRTGGKQDRRNAG